MVVRGGGVIIQDRDAGGRRGRPGSRRWRAAWWSREAALEGNVVVLGGCAGGLRGRQRGGPGGCRGCPEGRRWWAPWSSGTAGLVGAVREDGAARHRGRPGRWGQRVPWSSEEVTLQEAVVVQGDDSGGRHGR